MSSLDFRTPPLWLAAGLALLWLAGCSTPKPAPQTTPYVAQDAAAASGGSARPAAAGAYTWSPTMADTSQRLEAALRGSGMAVSQTTDQRLWLSLPVDAAFDKGRSAVKPAAAASLDQVALALRTNTRALVQIVGDPDTLVASPAGIALALDRAASARDWIVGRGVVASRIVVASRNAKSNPPADAPRLDILVGERGTAPPR